MRQPMSSVRAALQRWRAAFLAALLVAPLSFAGAGDAPVGHVESFTIDNGLEVIVIADHRVPIVTHMVWYKVGSIDDPPGSSGLAHLLEHLMFKAFDAGAQEGFAQAISRLGGIDNASTTHDSTHYWQRVARDNLGEVMALEAARMGGLTVKAEQALVERDVVREERRANVDSDPVKLLTEEMMAALHRNHSYGRPPIGWAHEIAELRPEDALAAYRRFYRPDNAVLVVAGDVAAGSVRRMAEATYGRVARPGEPMPERSVVREPSPLAAQRLTMADARVAVPTLLRSYIVPSRATARGGEAEHLDVLLTVLGEGEASLLHSALVEDAKTAVSVGARYFGEGRDYGRLVVYVLGAAGHQLSKIEAGLDQTIARLIAEGPSPQHLDRAKAHLDVRHVLTMDSQMASAKRIGEARVAGRALDDVMAEPRRIGQVTSADVRVVARTYLDPRRSVTGLLMPQGQETAP
ncbi:MAG: pitrilysin family protein [Hyphomicrobiaceae bacterium]|nr:pitrilysin family protein [Hyphomicrobiaceae bacterium]